MGVTDVEIIECGFIKLDENKFIFSRLLNNHQIEITRHKNNFEIIAINKFMYLPPIENLFYGEIGTIYDFKKIILSLLHTIFALERKRTRKRGEVEFRAVDQIDFTF